MKTIAVAPLLLILAGLACCEEPPVKPPPVNPPPADVVLDRGVFDVFQGLNRRQVETFSIIRKGDGDTQIRGEAKLALPDPSGNGSIIYDFYPDIVYGNRGAKRYVLSAKFPTGPGSTTVETAGGQCVWKFIGPNNQVLGPVNIALPVTGIVLDRRIMAQFAIFGLQQGQAVRPCLDPDSARLADVRVSKPVPARIETLLGNFLCERVLVTIGSFGANLWFNSEGFLLRVEIPHFGIVGIRRGCYGTPGTRTADPNDAVAPPQNFQMQDGRAILAGDLWQPGGNGPFNTAIILSDSGLQDSKGNPPGGTLTWNHQRDWSIALRNAGVCAISPDDPGGGWRAVAGANNPGFSDMVNHATGLVQWARQQPGLKGGKVGVIGHGEGGLIALQLAANKSVDFVVLVDAHGATIDSIFIDQMETGMKRDGVDPAVLKTQVEDSQELQKLFLDKTIKVWKAPQVPERFVQLGGMREWFCDMMSYDPVALAAKATCPVFVVHGEEDHQIPLKHFEALKAALTKARVTADFKTCPGLDHFLMPVINGDDADTADPDRRTDKATADEIAKWIHAR